MNKTIRAGLLLSVLGLGASACTSLLGGFDFEGTTGSSGGMTTTGTGGNGGATTSSTGTGGSAGTTSTSSGTGGTMCVDPTKDCPAPASECVTAVCDAGGLCAVMNVADGGPVTAQTAGDCKKDVCDGAGKTKSVDDNTDINDDTLECTTDTCAAGAPVHTPLAVNTPCGAVGGTTKCDGAGACVGCVAPADCGAAPACKANTCTAGTCGTMDLPDATACSDGNGCTQTDTCQAGACVGANPVVCTALDQCHNAGACAPATGVCSLSSPKGDGTACSDNNLCTQADSCLAGVCTGSNPVTCPVPDQCHNVAACAPATGMCATTPKANGTVCNDGNGCTTTDKCQAGTCSGTTVVCTALDECHDVGTCGALGVCSNPMKTDGSPCANGSDAGTGTCTAGVCL